MFWEGDEVGRPEFSFKASRERLSERVARHIQDCIMAGKLKPGDKLPTEAEMCRQFGTSRTVIREAMTSLAGKGLLCIGPGRGTYVAAMSAQDMSESFGLFVRSSDISLRNVTEVRDLLEVRIAELAAERATAADLTAMQRAVDEMDASIDELDGFLRADLSFHMALAEATQNDILFALVGSLVEKFQDVRRMGGSVRTGNVNAQLAHKAILDCVRRKDSVGAGKAMREHLQEVVQRYEAARRSRMD